MHTRVSSGDADTPAWFRFGAGASRWRRIARANSGTATAFEKERKHPKHEMYLYTGADLAKLPQPH